MKPLTNETLIEEIVKQFVPIEAEYVGINAMGKYKYAKNTMSALKAFILSALQAKEGEMKEKIKSKKKYWHIRFEGISDPVISAERKKFNEEVSELINSVLDDLLSNLSK